MKRRFTFFGITFLSFIICIQLWSEDLPELTVEPAPDYDLSFGITEVGKSVEREVHLINTGKGILAGSVTIENPKQSSTNEEEKVFFISGDIAFSLFENQTAVVKIQFIPLKSGEYQGKLKVTASDNQSAEITLKGIGIKKRKEYYVFGCGEMEKSSTYYLDFIILSFAIFYLSFRFRRITG